MKVFHAFLDVWDDILVYSVTLLGVLVAQYIPAFKAGREFQLVPSWGNLAVGAVIALSFVLKDEEIPAGTDKVAARAGKKANFRRRLSSGLAQGMMWATLSGAVS